MAKKLEVIRDMDSNRRNEVAQVCVESHSPLWSCIKKKKWDSVEEQALQWGEISKCMIIHEANHGSMENELFELFLSCLKEQYFSGWPNSENKDY